jgi:hypothetical protein
VPAAFLSVLSHKKLPNFRVAAARRILESGRFCLSLVPISADLYGQSSDIVF